MNKTLLSFIFTCLIFQSCQESVSVLPVSDVIIDKESRIFMSLDSTLLNGKHKLYFTDSIIAIDASFVEGKLNGDSKFYYPSGILSAQGSWVNGNREGKHTSFWEDGIISSDQNYKDDKLQGESLDYWQDGSLYINSVYDNGVELSHIWYAIDSSLVEDMSLIDKLKRSLEKYIIQGYIENSDSGLNWVKIVDDEILISCHCLPNSYGHGDLNDPVTGKECPHGTNPWAENGRSASVFYPDVPILVGDLNKDGVDDYIINYTIEGMGGGNSSTNANVLIINNGLELLSLTEFRGDVLYNSIGNEFESISDEGIFTIDHNYDSAWKLKSTDTVLHKYIEPFQVFEKIKYNESSVQIDNILTIYKNELVELDLQNEIISKGLTLLTELKYCQRENGTVWNGLSDEFAALLPVCQYSDSYTIHMLTPNYLVVQPKSVGTCGSGGCSIEVFSYTDGVFIAIDNSNFSTLLSQESTDEYIVEAKSKKINGGRCSLTYKRKFNITSDTINHLEVYDELHVITDTLAHKRFCSSN
jgi:antitoxin component YwqK of YwqJK toxin-antitoxin module